jgi:hypothetical protein
MAEVVAALQYPTADLPVDQVRNVLALAAPQTNLIQSLGTLDFLVEPFNAASYTAENAFRTHGLKVQGLVRVVAQCASSTPANGSAGTSGSVTMVLGVRNSLIQREVSGTITDCAVRSNYFTEDMVSFHITAELGVDLGRELPLKAVRPPLRDQTFRLRNVHAYGNIEDSEGAAEFDETAFRFINNTYPVRAEILVSTASLGVPGMAVVTTTGTVATVRDAHGVWTCAGMEECTRAP